MQNMLKKILKGKVVIVGVGNPLRGDDGFGPALIERIKGKVKAVCINVGGAPENYTGKIIKEKPDTVLIVDALHLGLNPGEYRILKKEEILNSGFSTHDISPRMFIEYLEKNTQADIYLLGVQPQSVTFGQPISPPLQNILEPFSNAIGKLSYLQSSRKVTCGDHGTPCDERSSFYEAGNCPKRNPECKSPRRIF